VILLAPTITKIPLENRELAVVVSASHGGAYAGYLAALSGARAVILNDAGVGRDRAGIGALTQCEDIGMAAATVSATSARIGDAEDMMAHGVVSFANSTARSTGVHAGCRCDEAARMMLKSPLPSGSPEPYSEARAVVGQNPFGLNIICIDSVSLVEPSDAGQIVISGSHGGVVGGNAALAIIVDARAAFYNDAGVGKEAAGITRLEALDGRNIIAATVAAESARIGDGRNTYEEGVVSHVNACGEAVGIAKNMPLKAACELIC